MVFGGRLGSHWRCPSIPLVSGTFYAFYPHQCHVRSNNIVFIVHKYSTDENLKKEVDVFFVFVGGISVMTLLINGMTSGPLLSAVREYFSGLLHQFAHYLTLTFFLIYTIFQLNLSAKEKTRRKVIDNYMRQMIQVRTNYVIIFSFCATFLLPAIKSHFCLQGELAGLCDTAFTN